MRRIISCQFNIDTACVDVEYEDGFVLSIYTPTVEDAVAHTMQQRSELDWLIYNDPLAYVGLVMSGMILPSLKQLRWMEQLPHRYFSRLHFHCFARFWCM